MNKHQFHLESSDFSIRIVKSGIISAKKSLLTEIKSDIRGNFSD